MRLLFLSFGFFLLINYAFGQNKYNPSAIILEVDTFIYSSDFLDEIKNIEIFYQNEDKKSEEYFSKYSQKQLDSLLEINLPEENLREVIKQRNHFAKKTQSWFKDYVPQMAWAYITFGLERMPYHQEYFIYPIRAKSTQNINQLFELADKNNVRYVVAFPFVELFIKDNLKYAKIQIIVYDKVSDKIIYNKIDTKNTEDGSRRFHCEYEADCAILSVLYHTCWAEVSRLIMVKP